MDKRKLEAMKECGRWVGFPEYGDEDLGPLRLLPGTWKNEPNLVGRGWNSIALPSAGDRLNYRLLVNRYNEELEFSLVDKGVPNRGVDRPGPGSRDTDQLVVTLDYEQMIAQTDADDFPRTQKAGGAGLAIHHEPGLFLHMLNEQTEGVTIARLASIPHGNALLAVGTSTQVDGPPQIPSVNGLPIGVSMDVDANPYLAPYKRYRDEPFLNLFNPVEPHRLLEVANQGVDIVRTTQLEFDTSVHDAGIRNIPFIEREADAADMKSTFWIQELAEKDAAGRRKLRLQYLQVVLLDFFPRQDGVPGQIRWPHVSINTLEKVAEPDARIAAMPKP